MYCICITYVLCRYCICNVDVLWMFSGCIAYILRMYCIKLYIVDVIRSKNIVLVKNLRTEKGLLRALRMCAVLADRYKQELKNINQFRKLDIAYTRAVIAFLWRHRTHKTPWST